MTDIMKFNNSVIMTIPGIGYINGGVILASYIPSLFDGSPINSLIPQLRK